MRVLRQSLFAKIRRKCLSLVAVVKLSDAHGMVYAVALVWVSSQWSVSLP